MNELALSKLGIFHDNCCQFIFSKLTFSKNDFRNMREVALLCLSSWCLVIVVWLFLMMPRVCLQFVIVIFPDHTHLLYNIRTVWIQTYALSKLI